MNKMKTEIRLVPGYAYKSSRANPIDPETVVIGKSEVNSAKYCGQANIDGQICCSFKVDRTYYFQMVHMVERRQANIEQIIREINSPADLIVLAERYADIVDGKAGECSTFYIDDIESDRRYVVYYNFKYKHLTFDVLCDRNDNKWHTFLARDVRNDMKSTTGKKKLASWQKHLATLNYGLPYRYFSAYRNEQNGWKTY